MQLFNSLAIITYLFALWLFLVVGQVVADHSSTGPEFSDPTHRETLPKSWIKQPIQYREVPANSDLVITLDQHLYPALLPLIQDFSRQRGVQIAVKEGTCGVSAGALLDKKVDIGGYCCPPGETDRLPGLRFHTLGIAALALIVNPANPRLTISTEEARQIFSGKIAFWGEAANGNGESLPEIGTIQPVIRLHCKNRPGHWRLILSDEDHFSPLAQEVSTIPDMIKQVADQSKNIGFETLWMTRLHSSHPVKILHINGYKPSDTQAVLDGNYPFFRTYNITTWDSDETRKLLAGELVLYIQSHFESIHSKYGFISSGRLRKAGWIFREDELVGTQD